MKKKKRKERSEREKEYKNKRTNPYINYYIPDSIEKKNRPAEFSTQLREGNREREEAEEIIGMGGVGKKTVFHEQYQRVQKSYFLANQPMSRNFLVLHLFPLFSDPSIHPSDSISFSRGGWGC